jgi:hypothetical protein
LVDDFAVVFLVVDAPCVVVEEVAIGSSFFWAHELRNATVASAVIKVTRDVFISLVKLTNVENVDRCTPEQD